MKKLFKKLPLVAFVLAIGSAFAFKVDESALNEPRFGYDQTEDLWYDVTGLSQGVDYDCNGASEACLFDDVDGMPIASSNGEFIPGPGLNPVN